MDTRCFRRAGAAGAVLNLLAAIAGCTVGPNYQRPGSQIPDAYSLTPSPTTQPAATQPVTSQPAATQASPVDLTAWWRSFNDPTLDRLIEQAAESNYDLQVATARVRESRALLDIATAAFWPQVNSNAAYSRRGGSLNASARPRAARINTLRSLLPRIGIQPGQFNPATGALGLPFFTINGIPINGTTGPTTTGGTGTSGTTGVVSGGGVPRDQNLYQAGFDATWEIDIFGRIRRSTEAAEADLGAAEESRRDVLVTLLSEVALNYVQLRGSQGRLAVAEDNIRSQEDTLELTESKFHAGFGSALDVAQARAQLETTRSQVPLLLSSIRQSIYALGVLLGRPPEALLEDLLDTGPIPGLPPDVPIGLPSDLLRRRPDIRQAERTLAATTARIGVATADLFPTFSINGNWGPVTADIEHFLDQKSFAWSIGPTVTWPVFHGGSIIANIEATNAREEQALATYQKTFLIALQDVENSLVAYNEEKVRYRVLTAAVAANQQATELSNDLFAGGLIPFLNVLDAERALYVTQDALISSQTTTVTNLISLYKALGGGWESMEPEYLDETAAPMRESPPAPTTMPAESGGGADVAAAQDEPSESE